MFGRNGPILRTAAAAFGAYLLVLLPSVASLLRTNPSPARLALFFLLGLAYTQLFEYTAHRFAMHFGIPGLWNVRRNHLEHHQVFRGERFRTRRPEDLAHIPGRWWIFPLLLATHYLPAVGLLPVEAAMAFLLGAVVHYLLFETTHWFTHVEDNGFDRFLEKIPVLRTIRRYQIEHHRIHHRIPVVAFNFNPPYLGDRLTHRMPTPQGLRSLGVRELRVVPASAVVPPSVVGVSKPSEAREREPWFARPLIRYGTAAALLGVAALGLAVAAHGFRARDRIRGELVKPPPELAKV